MGWERREERGRSTCLPPRFDNPSYGPVFYTGQITNTVQNVTKCIYVHRLACKNFASNSINNA